MPRLHKHTIIAAVTSACMVVGAAVAERVGQSGDAPLAEQAKPFDEKRLVDAATAASEASASAAARHAELSEIKSRYESLTERRKQVMWLIVAGHSNKEVAARLGISVRTVETHRAWILERMRTKTLSELVRMSIQLRHGGHASDATSSQG